MQQVRTDVMFRILCILKGAEVMSECSLLAVDCTNQEEVAQDGPVNKGMPLLLPLEA